MSASMRAAAVRFTLALLCLLAMHVAIVHNAYATAIAVGLMYSCVNLVVVCSTAGWRSLWGPWAVPVLLMLGAQVSIWYGYASAVALVLAPSIVVNALLCVLFGHTLLPGQEPLITRFRRAEVGKVTPPFAIYTRHLTLLWAMLFAVGTLFSIIAALWGDFTQWSWVSLVAIPAASLLFFLGEHVYRPIRYGPEGQSSPLKTMRLMLNPDAWRSTAAAHAHVHGVTND